ncbi:MAG: hypothetical protein J6S67_25625 [Methanobrevibacter sp.]|nr:hypothetical protein [Methanobrevibacter sp.]
MTKKDLQYLISIAKYKSGYNRFSGETEIVPCVTIRDIKEYFRKQSEEEKQE